LRIPLKSFGTVLSEAISVGAFLCSKAVVPNMLKLRHGRIISFTSNEAFVGLRNGVPYAAAKAGIIGFSKGLALELAPY
jgi:NAD(P)-dependent dehydrogenase (short-subunit alcohol dehydrogenase family)